MISLALGGVGSLALVFGVLFALQFVRNGLDAEAAAESTTESILGVVSGVIVAGVAVASELLAAGVAAILTAPDTIATVVLGVIGYMSIEGIVTVQPETYGLLVIVAFVVVVVGSDMRGSSS